MNDLLTFQEFETKEEAVALAAKLEEYGINAVVEQDRNLLDQNIIGRQYTNYVKVKIAGSDFEQAQKMLIETTTVDLSKVEKGYMLLSLNNDELRDVVARPDEWGAYNYNLAIALLQQRGVPLDEESTAELKQNHLAEISKRRNLSPTWLAFGYGFSLIGIAASLTDSRYTLFILFRFYLLPGIFGIIFGLVIRHTRRTLPNGKQILSYDDAARRHGLFMLLAGILSLAFIILRGIAISTPQL